jgi:hypothetical protein
MASQSTRACSPCGNFIFPGGDKDNCEDGAFQQDQSMRHCENHGQPMRPVPRVTNYAPII